MAQCFVFNSIQLLAFVNISRYGSSSHLSPSLSLMFVCYSLPAYCGYYYFHGSCWN